jgi:hypothetical protein
MYGGCTVLAVTNLAVNGSTFTALDLGLVVAGLVPWAVAATQSIYRKVQACRQEMHADEDVSDLVAPQTVANNTQLLRGSTHAAINASLHMTAATFFTTGDALYLAGAVPNPAGGPSTSILAARTTGSVFWFLSAGVYLLMAVAHDRKKEDHPNEVIKPFGIANEVYNLTGESIYLGAGVLYAYAIYAYDPINPIKATANTLWLIANSMGTVAAIYELVTRNSAALQEQPQHDFKAQPTVTVLPDDTEVAVQVSSTEESEQISSDVVIERPGF